MSASKTIEQLQNEIGELTGRVSVSKSREFLERRVAELRAAKRSGTDTRAKVALVSVSMSYEARDALAEFAEAKGLTFTKLGRAALVEYFNNHNQKKLATLIADEE